MNPPRSLNRDSDSSCVRNSPDSGQLYHSSTQAEHLRVKRNASAPLPTRLPIGPGNRSVSLAILRDVLERLNVSVGIMVFVAPLERSPWRATTSTRAKLHRKS